jgi:hypothetical protein
MKHMIEIITQNIGETKLSSKQIKQDDTQTISVKTNDATTIKTVDKKRETCQSCLPTTFVFSYAVTENCSICLQPPKLCSSNMPLFQLLISRSVFCPFGSLLACCRAALAGHLQPQFRKHYSNTQV